MLETLKTGNTAHVVHEFPKSKDKPTYGHIVTYPLKNEAGETFKIIEVWRDITEDISSRWEERSRELKADLNKMVQEDRMVSLGKLAASCAHEINNPIQGLLTFSDLMQEILTEGFPTEENLEKFRHFLSLMSKELERCGNIVSGLLSFSRETQLEYKSVVLNDVLESVITLTRHKMALQNIQLVTNLTTGIIIVRGDANRLQQVLLNLIFNAIEAMEKGGQLDIVTKHNRAQRQVQIQIHDTGHGIPEKHLDHIYDPFFTTKEEGEGTGLGLSIVYGVMKNHGGKIAVKSTLGKGTVFTLTFPVLESLNNHSSNDGG
jgi:signal transduction histidine kinase